ncbi:MAG: glutathione-disulfide reductase [Bermanella sp.]
MDNFDYDLFVIGAGSGGVRASRIAASLGAKVAVAEDRYMGGTCVNVGCVPKKLYVYASEFSQSHKDAEGFGWAKTDSSFNWNTLRDNKVEEISRLNGIYENLLNNNQVSIINGRASISGPNSVVVNGQTYTAKNLLIATGGWPYVPEFPGSEHATTSNEIFDLAEFPKRVIVVGGGYIAVEFAGIFNGLGSDTKLLYRGEQILRGFDTDVREFAANEMQMKGVDLRLNTNIETLEKLEDGSLRATLINGDVLEADQVLYATGRVANTHKLGLETLDVETNRSGQIVVDENFQTNEPGVYALGDVIGGMELTPVALAEGMALARHLFGGQAINMDYDNIPTAVFCQPNIATVGLTEEKAKGRFNEIDVYKSAFRALKNTVSGNPERTLMKLIVDKSSDKVVGAHMVGPDAGEIIQGIAIAIKAGATKAMFDSTIGIHPTAAEEFVTMREPVS